MLQTGQATSGSNSSDFAKFLRRALLFSKISLRSVVSPSVDLFLRIS